MAYHRIMLVTQNIQRVFYRLIIYPPDLLVSIDADMPL